MFLIWGFHSTSIIRLWYAFAQVCYDLHMTDLEKEHLLHKVVASSAFLFALLILPVAQYLLVSSQPQQQGEVAGVSTEAPQELVAPQRVLTPAECEVKRTQDQADLDKWAEGKKRAMLTAYEAAVKPYKETLTVLTGDQASIDEEKSSLNRLIEDEYRPYLEKLASVDAAVATSHQEIVSRTCGDQ